MFIYHIVHPKQCNKHILVYNFIKVVKNPDKKFVCSVCGKGYKYKNNMKQHQRMECGKEPQFQCPHCDKKTHQKGSLKRHIYTMHLHQMKKYKDEFIIP
ncbi:hypothetical protein LSTR_LSTR000939 [Laodelphax striatellus]|uniref:C2H2-type domain-containing protein n=1 Tax=Laodelphax striatellus TaxID=195883 RepID=A0A482X0X7_LAOST|nr:hypothetical protein LSTR_LSTR000939 [Laodelphax striatellus]